MSMKAKEGLAKLKKAKSPLEVWRVWEVFPEKLRGNGWVFLLSAHCGGVWATLLSKR